MKSEAEPEGEILALTRELIERRQARAPAFDPEASPLPYGGRVYGPEEVQAVVKAGLDFWLTHGPEADAFEAELAAYVGGLSTGNRAAS